MGQVVVGVAFGDGAFDSSGEAVEGVVGECCDAGAGAVGGGSCDGTACAFFGEVAVGIEHMGAQWNRGSKCSVR